MDRDPVPGDAVGMRLEITRADRDRLHVASARAGKSMASYLRMVVLAHLDSLDKSDGKKSRSK